MLLDACGLDGISLSADSSACTNQAFCVDALINPYKLGYTIYKTYLKLEVNRERWTQLVAFLNKHPNTFWLAECYGSSDLIWGIAARTPKEAYDIQNQLFSDFSDVVMSYNVYTFVNTWWFPKKYLLGSAG